MPFSSKAKSRAAYSRHESERMSRGMHAWQLCRALHDLLILLLSPKAVIRLIHSVQTGIEYLVSVCDPISSQIIPSLSDGEAELQEGSIEEDELDVSNLKRGISL